MKRLLKIIISLSCLVFLASCSTTSNKAHEAKDIKGIVQAAKKSNITVEGFTDLTRIYRLRGLTIEDDLFFTALNDCRQKATSLQNLLGNMLVGFNSPVITDQTYLDFENHKVLRSVVATERNDQTLYMMIYTVSKSGCVSDYAFWTQSDLNDISQSDQDQLDTFIKELTNRRN